MSRDAFFYWWPVVARLVGVLGGLAQIAAAIILGQQADVAGLGFCGALIAAPTIFPTGETGTKHADTR